ncbi:low temperature requirement protein A [Micromonospora parathelypteridis]|uniref:Low temperature requirement protein LtrA n=1 Tax=Micromonospora parathelypteridis TaxID=1839617 RepID=A0A840VQM1_9ACTN|nr:low temperature requirement protein A [Micromonospora parathelypteridis]MBB5476314.1 low temperature requirement protein LtrA [Micromonospora parathelypteridis]GGO14562.1 membrane protein [Micromonospora parathelypteridis]
MSERHRDELVRSEATRQRATFLELFLDLVFVFALTRISARVIDDFTDGQRGVYAGLGQALLLFLALWAVWSLTVWSTSWLDPEAPIVQTVIVMTMVGSMTMAVAVPDGFGARAPLFAITYVSLQIGRVIYFHVAGHGRPDPRQTSRVLFWFGLSAPLWVIGGLADEGTVRGPLWTIAVLIDYTGLLLGWPTPRIGAQRIGGPMIAAEHLAERYQQFLLIAIGEAIFVIGLAFSGSEFHADQTVGFLLALATTVLFWRIYFHVAGGLLDAAVSRSRSADRLATDMAFTHLIMIAGIVLSGVGFELFVTEPLGHLPAAWLIAILGGPVLFLVGRSALEYQVFARVSRSRIAGLLTLGLLTPVTLHLTPLAAGAAAAVVLLGVAAADTRRSRRHPPETATPPY